MRLIDADLIEELLGCEDEDIYCKETIREAPTIEAVPVVYGEWEQTRFAGEYICSNCQSLLYAQITKTGYKKSNFCPHCGADMRSKCEVERNKIWDRD